MARDFRQRALDKIASLAATSSYPSFDRSDFDRLCSACSTATRAKDAANGFVPNTRSVAGAPAPMARVPMTICEFQVLVSLCKAAPNIRSVQNAQRLAYQLAPYIQEAHMQLFAPSPYFRKVEPSPSESLTFHVSAALLHLGKAFPELQDKISDNLWAYLASCAAAAEKIEPPQDDDEPNLDDAMHTATIAVSLLGFLDAVASQPDFWTPASRLSLVQNVRRLLSDRFLVAMETAFSTLRVAPTGHRTVKEWKRYLKHYTLSGRPLSSMLVQRSFTWLLISVTSLLIVPANQLRGSHILDVLMSGKELPEPVAVSTGDANTDTISVYTKMATASMLYFEAGADFVVQLGSSLQQRLAFSVKSAALIAYVNCAVLNDDAADPDTMMAWLEEILADPVQMTDELLASTVLRGLAVLCRLSPDYALGVSRLLPRFIIQSSPNQNIIALASHSLAYVLQILSKDAVITTLYSLGNVLSPASERPRAKELANGTGPVAVSGSETAPEPASGYGALYNEGVTTGSFMSLSGDAAEEAGVVHANVVQAICGIAQDCNDEKITALAQSMLLQKFGKVNSQVDAQLIAAAGALALKSGVLEFRSLLKMYARISHQGVSENSENLLDAVMKARTYLSTHLNRDSPLYGIYWEYLLDSVIALGDVSRQDHTKEADVQLAAREIAQLLKPLAVFMSTSNPALATAEGDKSSGLLRDAWFNITVYGFLPSTDRGKAHLADLRTIALHSPPLVAEQPGEKIESDIELNTVLRRAMSSEREAIQKKSLSELLPSRASEIRGLSYRKVIFLQAVYLVESLRADAGDCTKALSYFVEPSMRKGDLSGPMDVIAATVVDKYLHKTLQAADPAFSAQYVAYQLASIFSSCCHRVERVQQAAFACADRILNDVPSALCYRSSLFALLELLSLMWTGCLEAETDVYDPRSVFTSSLGKVTIELSQNYTHRRSTMDLLYRKAKTWVTAALTLAPADVKGLLQTYLSEYDDAGAYGHISLGRSFALEMGSLLPSTDQRLQAMDRIGDISVNTASDFIAQYTTRQEYRFGETLPTRGTELLSYMRANNKHESFMLGKGPEAATSLNESASAATALQHIEARILSRKPTPLSEVREILRRAAALLCRSPHDETAAAHHLVSIPFAMFTRRSLKLGVSLWLGVVNENPRLEPRLLNEISHHWEATVHKKQGMFNPALAHPDPFFLRCDFSPTDLEALAKRKQLVHNLLSPHTSLLQFFTSHFNATRLGSPDTQRIFLRLLDTTLDALRHTSAHPLARDLRFQIVLFGLRVLRLSSTIGAVAQWRLKDKILSAALGWFRFAPRWSFGSNLLQMKTELRLLSDVITALKAVNSIGVQGTNNIRSLQAKEQLLNLLLESELQRLAVWVYPLPDSAKHAGIASARARNTIEAELIPLVRTAWSQDPSIAIELVSRFNWPRIHKEVRWLLLNVPSNAINEPEALAVLFGGKLPEDVTFLQLKHLLFWAPVNPLTAVTLFLPEYKNNPFVMQYAMRALESHPINVTFFYVPQIVQTLRYDTLGYVERYILETAQFSQLFAHQIIWNMKANAYKDDDGQIPDELKPTLDSIMNKMVTSFSIEDRVFYEREFAFFDEVTGVSGKLKPFIKSSREIKKQKIEEELRKIKVEVGVYLPSNPDGVVIGIDRKSGKPLQSHAKAPYLATFRVQKRDVDDGGDDLMQLPLDDSDPAPGGGADVTIALNNNTAPKANSVSEANSIVPPNAVVATVSAPMEVWQSCIFKVGDDCRQDVLALQMIAAFRGIFNSVGLDVFVYPYRVIATAPGCGVIEVLPNSISRDMLGREAVNKLYDYFVSKYGNEDSLRFQAARANFVKSMAAYSVISFLLQFKDRHNGNIMIDDQGHILHIDFGFCFDIAPGGIKFERAPFKLTTEMMAVMGGSPDHQAFRWFEELCVKAFLAARPYAHKLAEIVHLMMDSGLPCFKPESVKHFVDRFVLDKSEKEAADFMRDLIHKSYASYSTGIYDHFQLLTNGIPY
ncbi:Phosphatidylinositol 4-kinase stt4 [Ceratocystis pirilliformis]|uniref:1-phosphatidylinositol 4-kinase n=1 Tax=Ceratocystis pirilliformis TaxID=259994 RepID=A0ABR3ZGR0_9PEZI